MKSIFRRVPKVLLGVMLAISPISLIPLVTSTVQAQTAPQPIPLTILVYEAGSQWVPGKPPQEQNLAPHFSYVGKKFQEGALVAYGPQIDAVRGYYVLKGVDWATIKDFIDNDPGVKSGTFRPAAEISWAVAINNFTPQPKGEGLSILRYKPGVNWVKGRSLMQQDIKEHFSYVTDLTKKGILIAGGPNMGADEGLYIVRVENRARIDDLIKADPGVKAGIFAPEVIGWNLQSMQALKKS